MQSGSPARYRLHADAGFTKTISAILALRRRHVPIAEAKAAVERMVLEHDITIDLPMLEDAAAFENEMRELCVRAEKREIAAAAEG